MQFIPLRPYLPNDRYQDFPFFFFAHEYAFIPFFPFHALKPAHAVTAQDSCDMRDRLLRYFATCGQEKPLSGSLKRGEKNA